MMRLFKAVIGVLGKYARGQTDEPTRKSVAPCPRRGIVRDVGVHHGTNVFGRETQ